MDLDSHDLGPDGYAIRPAGGQEAPGLVVGRVSEDPRSAHPRLEAFGAYLTSRLASGKEAAGRGFVAASNREMIAALREGRVDVLSEGPFSAMEFAATGLAEPLLLEKKRGEANYRSILVTRHQSGIQMVGDLVGKKVGFEDPSSTTGYFLPMVMLRAAGLKPIELHHLEDQVPTDRVGYIFLKAEINVAAAAAGLIDAGALSNVDWRDKDRLPKPIKDKLAIFQLSDPVPHSILMVRTSLDAAIKEKLRELLLHHGNAEESRKALRGYYGVTGYEVIDEKQTERLDRLRQQSLTLGD
jgi:phosphonate transport system substrate-binding protein